MCEIYKDDYTKLPDLINKTEIRNIKVRCFWEGLKHSDFNYRQRIEITVNTFFISQQLIDRIVSKKRKQNGI